MFVMVLQFTSSKLMGAARVITSINRFYPSIQKYSAFVSEIERRIQYGKDVEISGVKLESGEICPLTSNKLCGLLLPNEATRTSIQGLLVSLHGNPSNDESSSQPAYWLVGGKPEPGPVPVGKFFGINASDSSAEIRKQLEYWGVEPSTAASLAENLDEPATGSVDKLLDPVACIALSLIAARHHEAGIVIVDYPVCNRLEEGIRRRLLEGIASKLPIFVSGFDTGCAFATGTRRYRSGCR